MHTNDMLPLEQLKIASPCSANWETMTGDDRVRFCSQCQLQVFNLSALTTDEAVQLISQSTGRMCVRYYRRHDGTVLTQDCPVGRTRVQRRMKWLAAGVAGVLTLAAGGLLATAGVKAIDQQLANVTITTPSSFNATQAVTASIRTYMTSWWEYFFPPPPTVLMGDICLPPPPVLVTPPLVTPAGNSNTMAP